MLKTDISSKQLEILEASGKILITKGIKALTTKNLAIEMGFSESAIYRHFANKEEIIVSLFEYILGHFKLRLNQIITNQSGAIEKLNSIFESQCAFFSENPHFTMAVLADDIYYEGEKVKSALSQIMAYKFGIILGILETGIKAGSVRNDIESSQLLHTIVGSFRLLLHKWRLSNFDFDLPEAGKKMMNTLNVLLQKPN